MFSRGYQNEASYKNFQYFVVIDFEATCDEGKKIHPQEIIEFPSVLVNGLTGELESSFQIYVRPIYHQLLTNYCKELTGIQQIQVDRGVSLSEALLMHDKWLQEKGVKHDNFALVTWGDWDFRVMLESECRFKRIIKPPYFNRWINLKIPFQEVFGGDRRNLKDAIQLAGLPFQGRWHCGLDDARNTANLLVVLMQHGYRFSITSALEFLQTPNVSIVGPTTVPYRPSTRGEKDMHCYCGVKSNRCVVRKPGPTQGKWFFGCGNWTAARGAVCTYFEWASC